MEKILEHLWDTLKGPEFWVCAVLFAIAFAVWRAIGAGATAERKTLLLQLAAAAAFALLGLMFVVGHRVYLRNESKFSDGTVGILIASIGGDDQMGSLQAALIAHLNGELQKEPSALAIEVHGIRDPIDEAMGLSAAHNAARALGLRLNARVVLWGRKVGDKQFFPRLTIVRTPETWHGTKDRTHLIKDITDFRLPSEVVDEPLYLIDFVIGYSYYVERKYEKALPYFHAALQRKGSTSGELADLQFQTANCLRALGVYRKSMSADFQECVGLLDAAAEAYEKTDRYKWAMVQSTRAGAYVDLPSGKRPDNYRKAIAASEAALSFHTEEGFPVDWAVDQLNRATAYRNLMAGNRQQNAEEAINATKAAMRVLTETAFPVEWAHAQTGLGLAYRNLAEAINKSDPLKDALLAFKEAMRVFTEDKFPYDWAMTELHVGFVCLELPSKEKNLGLNIAIRAFERSLTVLDETRYPYDWATAKSGLGTAYRLLSSGDQISNQERAITALESALHFFSQSGYPSEWAIAQANLGSTYLNRTKGDRRDNLRAAITCYKSALGVLTDTEYPDFHLTVTEELRTAEKQLKEK